MRLQTPFATCFKCSSPDYEGASELLFMPWRNFLNAADFCSLNAEKKKNDSELRLRVAVGGFGETIHLTPLAQRAVHQRKFSVAPSHSSSASG
mmetsp:Transcript_73748/g.196260  ORF Transcript_73748/g.196260 Transcript_73748/m.196260 type:complete len:93 (-) Transcript_73748:960-1238(-)